MASDAGADGSAPAEPGAASNHPHHSGRRSIDPQPDAREYSSRNPSQRWECSAIVEQERSGKAAGTWVAKTLGPFSAATREEMEKRREDILDAWLHPKRRAAATGARFTPSEATREKRQRSAALQQLLPERRAGPSHEQARPGPGRGHRAEAAGSTALETPVMIEQLKANANWFAQAAARQVRGGEGGCGVGG